MSVELGHGAGGGKIVSDLLDEASDEFAYIEFLRERFFAVRSVSERVRRIRRELAHHASMIAEIDPVLRLIAVPLRSLGEKITDADDHAADVVSLFGGFEMHQKAVRIIRDDLHRRLRPWDEIVEAWRYVSDRSVDPYATIPLLRDLYRFLAPRYMPADTWALMLAAEAGRENRQGIGNVVTWYERQSEPA
jgi:hypothetical protein